MNTTLIEARKRKNLTQVQLAVAADVSCTIISGLETGTLEGVTPRIARKLAPAYGVDISVIPIRPRKAVGVERLAG